MARIKVYDKNTQSWVYADSAFSTGGNGNVTAESITAALGYMPASETSVSQLSEKIAANTAALNEIGTQEDIVQQVISALGTPVFGRVDENKHITLSGHLVDGTYTIRFEDTDGFTTDVCTINKTSAPSYTNLLDVYTVYRDKRFSSSEGAVDNMKDGLGMICLKIPVIDLVDKTLRIKGRNIAGKSSSDQSTTFQSTNLSGSFMGYLFAAGDASLLNTGFVSEGNDTYSIVCDAEHMQQYNNAANRYGYFSLVVNTAGTAVTDEELAEIIITLDEPIE